MRRLVPPVPTRSSCVRILSAAALAAAVALTTLSAQIPGRNVNMVSGTSWPEGDPFLQRQNEPSLAASTRNPLHLLGGSNDYRTVDVPGLCTPDPDSGECKEPETGDAWLGLFKSFDGGQRWTSTLLPGYPQDQSPAGLISPLKGYLAAADPVVRPGTNGLMYYSGLVFDRDENGKSAIFVTRFIDNNNQEAGDPFAYLGTRLVATSTGAQFLDKPWMTVDIPRGNAAMCTIAESDIIATAQNGKHRRFDNPGRGKGKGRGNNGGAATTQRVPAGAVYVAYSSITQESTGLRSEIFVTRSMDCGNTWSAPIRVSRPEDQINQGSNLTIDPRNGTVYVSWRRFDPNLSDTTDLDAIMVARLPFGSKKADAAQRVHQFPAPTRKVGRALHRLFEHRANRFKNVAVEADENLDQFDLGTSGFNFRTNAYPTMAADGTGRIYLAWTQRGFRADSGAADGARLVITTTQDGKTFTTPTPVDNHDDPGRGHQLMPSMTFAGGRLMLVFYDLRESRAQTFNRIMSDLNTVTGLRQTIDIRSAMAAPADQPQFAPSVKVSDYVMGINPRSGKVEDLQVNPPNLPMFKLGTVPFMGDYIDLAAAPAFIQKGKGKWVYNTEPSDQPPIFHAAWTDNRDVRPPRNGDWTKYTPAQMSPGQGPRTSIFDPTQTVPECSTVDGNPGSRNQNVYSSRITGGLLAGSPGNAKPLSTGLQRAFVVFAQNASDDVKSFRMTILNQPVGGRASFEQFPLPPYTSSSAAPETAIEMIVPARSTASRTVYATSTDPDATINIDVSELIDLRNLASPADYPTAPELPGGQAATVVLNPDIENPDIENPDIENPDIENPDIENSEVYNPDIENPDIENPDIENPDIENVRVQNPDIENPDIENPDIENPDIENVQVANPDIENPDIENPDIENPDIENPDIENPDIENPDIENGSIADVTWQVTNNGNTTASFNVNVFLASQTLPAGLKTQLVLLKTYRTPVTVPNGCQLGFQTRNILLTSIRNPVFVTPGQPLPDQNDPAETNATLWLAPGEEGRIVLRVIDDDTSNNLIITKADGSKVSIDPSMVPTEDVSPVVQQQAVNTVDATGGVTEPPVVPPPAPRPTSDEAWTSAQTPIRMNVLRNDAALWGSTIVQTQHDNSLWQNSVGIGELVYMPANGLLYAGGSRAISVIDPLSRRLIGVVPLGDGDPGLTYGVASPKTGLLFFRSGQPGQPNASLYVFDVRPSSPTFNQPMPVAAATMAAIDALGSAFTFALNDSGTVLYYAAGSTTQQTIAAIDANPMSPTFAQILWQHAMPAAGQVRHIAQNPATGKLYIASLNFGGPGGGVYVTDGAAIARIEGADQSISVAINSATNLVYAAGAFAQQYHINAIDGATDTLITRLPPVAGPIRLNNAEERLRIHNGTGRVFLRSGAAVFVIDGAKGNATFNTVLASISLGADFSQSELAINQSTGVLAAAGNFYHRVALIDAVTLGTQDVFVQRTGGRVEFDPTSGRLFFSDFLSTIYEIAPAAIGSAVVNWSMSIAPETTIPVVNPVTNRAYVGTSDVGSSIDVYSSAGKLGPVSGLTVDVGRWLFGGRHDDTNTFYFANSASDISKTQLRPGTLAVVDGATDTVTAAIDTVGQPFGLGVNQARNHVYVAGLPGLNTDGIQEPGAIAVHDGTNPANFAIADTSAFNSAVAFGRDIEVLNDRAYVAVLSAAPPEAVAGSPAPVAYLDGAPLPGTHVAQPLVLPAPFTSNDRVDLIRINPENNFVYLGLFNFSTGAYNVAAFDRDTHTLQAAFPGGGHSRMHTASWLAVDPSANRLYVVDYNADTIQALDATTLLPVGAPVTLADGPSAMVLNPVAKRIYVSSINAKTLTAIDAPTMTVMSTVKLPLQAFFLAVNPAEGRIYTAGGVSQDESGYMVVPDVGGMLGHSVSVSSVSTPAGGTATINPDYSITYTPAPGFSGDDTFSYSTTTIAGTATANVTVHVVAPVTNPVALPDSFALAAAAPSLVIPAADLLSNDVFTGPPAITVVTNPSHGNLIDSAVSPGGYDYVPNSGYQGPDSFQYRFTAGATSNVATVSIWVTPSANPLIVTNTNDSGFGSLRNAIEFANRNPGADAITFNIPGTMPVLINLASPLPQISEAVSIDGRTQPGWSAAPVIAVRSPSTTAGWTGFFLGANNITIAGLTVTNFLEGIHTPAALSGHVVQDSAITGNVRGLQWRSNGGLISRNVIGNNGEGLILNSGAAKNLIEHNRIGMQADGLTPLPNLGNGVVMYDGVLATQLTSNIISGNGGWGVDIQHSGDLAPVEGTVFANNNIGLDANGNLIAFGGDSIAGETSYGPFVDFGPENRGNRLGGIHLNTAPATTIGGVGFGNTISGNSQHGILVDNTPAPGVVIRSNIVGLDPNGTTHRGNTRNGIWLVNSVAAIGGNSSGEGNVVSGNILNGIAADGNVDQTTVIGNKIGTTRTGIAVTDGTLPLGNGILTSPNLGCCHAGVYVVGAGVSVQNNVIAGNMIGVRSTTGLREGGPPNVIAANFIGTDESATLDLGNANGVFLANDQLGSLVSGNTIFYSREEGVLIAEGSSGATIGGSTDDANLIAFNRDGVVVGYDATATDTNHVITFNSISGNTNMGIDLARDGVTVSDELDADSGPNALQNYPVITSATLSDGLMITIDTTSFANTSHDVQFFSTQSCDASGHGQGGQYLGQVNVTAPGVQNVSFAAGGVAAGWYVTATATGPNGTSEFSACRQVTAIGGSISSVAPSPFATSFGQLVTLEGIDMKSGKAPDVIFTQGETSWSATFAFQLSPTRIIVRAPSELTPGVPATVRATNGASESTPPFAVTVSATPSAPILHSVHGGTGCGSGNGETTMPTAGAIVFVDATGVDTQGSQTTLVWTNLATGAVVTTSGSVVCASPSGRVLTQSTVPSFAPGTQVSLQLRTTTAGGTSPAGNGLTLTIVGPIARFDGGAGGLAAREALARIGDE